MKTLYCKSTVLFVLLLSAGLSLAAQSLKKDFHKELNVTSSSELVIDNQFGDITVTEWDQNKVVIDVIVEVKASDESKAKKLLDKITVEFKEEGSKLTAKTKIGENGKLNFNSDKGEKQSFSITYTVKCPKDLNLSLENQFGDIVVGSHSGPLTVDLQFGSFNAVALSSAETKIDMQFGKATIGSLKDAKLDVQHCDMVKISECGKLNIDAQFTSMEIGNLGSLNADLNNSELSIEELSGNMDLESNMGNVSVDHVSSSFESIIVEQNMGDLSLTMDSKAGYKMKASVNMGTLKAPDAFKSTKEKGSHIPGIKADQISGSIGDGRSSIKIESNMGTVKIR